MHSSIGIGGDLQVPIWLLWQSCKLYSALSEIVSLVLFISVLQFIQFQNDAIFISLDVQIVLQTNKYKQFNESWDASIAFFLHRVYQLQMLKQSVTLQIISWPRELRGPRVQVAEHSFYVLSLMWFSMWTRVTKTNMP